MRKKIFSNWGLKLLSVVIAFGLWVLVVQIENPIVSEDYYNIPVKIINTDKLIEEGKVFEVLDGSDVIKRVDIRARKKVLTEIKENDIVAVADFSKITQMDTVWIDLSVPSYSREISEIYASSESQAVLKLSIDTKSPKNLPLTVNVKGDVAEGYIMTSAKADLNRITISGPASKVEQISSAVVDVDVEGITSDLSASGEIKLYDKDNKLVDEKSIEKRDKTVMVRVSVLATKDVPIKYNVKGIPAKGYQTTDLVESIPNTVKLAGQSSVLDAIDMITIPEDILDVTERTENLVYNYNIKEYLPADTELADKEFNANVKVTVYIEKEISKLFHMPVGNIQMLNIPDGYEVNIIDEINSYEMQIDGLVAEVNEIRDNTLVGILDIKAWMEEHNLTDMKEGTYYIPVEVQIPETMSVSKPITVYVEVVKKVE